MFLRKPTAKRKLAQNLKVIALLYFAFLIFICYTRYLQKGTTLWFIRLNFDNDDIYQHLMLIIS